MVVETEFVEPQSGFGCPFVGYFPSGYDPLKNTHLKSSSSCSSPSVEVSAYQNTTKYKTKQLQLVAKAKEASVDFVGTNYSGEGGMWQPCNYLMGVFDKESKTLKLIPISGGRVFRMDARVRGVDYGDEEEGNVEELTAEERQEKYRLLTNTFGTHKSRLQATRQAKSKLKEEALGDQTQIGKFYEEAATNSTVLTNEEALARANASIIRNIPPYNASATKPENIYPLENIILAEEWGGQPDIDELIAAGKSPKTFREFQQRADYPHFVRNRIYKLRSETGDRLDRLAHVFSYITHLLNFKAMPVSAIKQLLKAKITLENDRYDKGSSHLMESSRIPGVTLAKFLKLFSDTKGNIPREKRDLLSSYILVLTLIADDFETEPLDIAKDLKITMNNLVSRYRELGCKSQKLKGSLKLTLPVPLAFPMLQQNRSRKKTQ